MEVISYAILFFALSIIITSFFNLNLSVALYISYLILVPYLEFKIAGFPLSYNLVNTLLLIVFAYQNQIKHKIKLNYQVVIPFLFLFLSLILLSLFTWGMPWYIQFNYWRLSFMQTCFLSFIIWNLALTDQKFFIYFKWAFILSMTIAGIYGLFLMTMKGSNPYNSMVSEHFGNKDAADVFLESKSRLSFSTAGKIQATMGHPMTWSLILCFSTIIFLIFYLEEKRKIMWALLGLIGFNLIISGVRTGIAALTIGLLYFLIRYRKIKLIILTLLFLSVITIFIRSNEDFSNLFSSFVDVSGQKSDIQGSSITMRLEQLQGALNEIKGHELAGKGYGWHSYYQSLYGDHPVLLAFESLLFMVLCNSGYIGLLIWISFFLLLYLLHRKILYKRVDIFIMDTFVITYAAYSTGTGDYGYLSFFSIFYSFLLAYLLKHKQPKILALQNTKRQT